MLKTPLFSFRSASRNPPSAFSYSSILFFSFAQKSHQFAKVRHVNFTFVVMVKKFLTYINEKALFQPADKVLLAVSGG
ncbi:MAG: hypothetical protein MUD08_11755, partial [Cytophagales bacterium]|nr:hypothetical protein [Cytophagales bacterium]